MLHGFEISHFRNFDETPQLIAPLGKLNIFIGSNNSGKSNILRYIRDLLAPVINDPRARGIKNQEENRSRFAPERPNELVIYVPASEEVFRRKVRAANEVEFRTFYNLMRKIPKYLPDSDLLGIPIAVGTNSLERHVGTISYPTDQFRLEELQHYSNRNFGNRYTPQDTLVRLEKSILQDQLPNIPTVYVPAFRQIRTRLSAFHDEYEKDVDTEEHIIDELIKFSNPTYDKQEQRESFEKLRDFIADITLIDDIGIDIPHDKSTINVEIDGHKRPIETLGSGVHELFLLASKIVLNEGKTILLEEPELHMHPEFQRKLMRFIQEKIDGQFFVTTHSAAVIDTPGAFVFGVKNDLGRARVEPLLRDQRRHKICRELGYRASDMLQANCLIWVEGPSDRIYLNYWIRSQRPDFREGIEYSIMFYGGRLLSRLALDEKAIDDFISLLPLNRSPAIVIDSDLGSAGQVVRETKRRIQQEIEQIGGLCWITEGREIENYVERDVREQAVKACHSTAEQLTGSTSRFGKPLNFRRTDGKEVTEGFNKVRIAQEIVARKPTVKVLDLQDRITDLIDFIERANSH